MTYPFSMMSVRRSRRALLLSLTLALATLTSTPALVQAETVAADDGPALYRAKAFGDAIPVLRAAAAADDAEAIYYMGLAYHHGNGVIADPGAAIEWYEKAVALGHPRAMFNLGSMYHTGLLVEPDLERAVELYRAGASLNDRNSLNRLGTMHFRGDGVDYDLEKAEGYWQQAAAQDDSSAMFNLALLYQRGGPDGVGDLDAARVWLEKAAHGGMVRAQMMLGEDLSRRRRSEQDLIDAWAWFQLAVDAGSAPAAQNRMLLEQNMSQEQLARAVARAEELASGMPD